MGSSVCLSGSKLLISAELSRHIKVRCIYLSGHRLGAEIVHKTVVVPYYPEFVVVVHFVAYHLAAVGVGHNCAVERLAVKSKSAAGIHIIADVLEHGAGSFNVLLVIIGKL